jgi:hypothetical protein
MQEMKSLGSEQTRKTYKRYGVQGEMFGVSYAQVDIAKVHILRMYRTSVFSNKKGKILYAGLITEWPMVISTAERGEVREMDATKEPFAGKRVKFFSPQRILNYIGCSLL